MLGGNLRRDRTAKQWGGTDFRFVPPPYPYDFTRKVIAMKVSDVLTPNVVAAELDDSVLAAARRMREAHVGDVVVVEDAEDPGRPVGILTDRDIVVFLIAEGSRDLDKITVGEAMTETPLYARTDDDIDDVFNIMSDRGVRRVPIVDGQDRLTGILTLDDCITFMRDRLDRLASVVTHEIDREVKRDRPPSAS